MFRLWRNLAWFLPACFHRYLFFCALQDAAMTVGATSRLRKSDSFQAFVTGERRGNFAPKLPQETTICLLMSIIDVLYRLWSFLEIILGT